MSLPSTKKEPPADRDRERGRASAVTTVPWFRRPAPPAHPGAGGTLLRLAVGAAAGGVLFRLGHVKIAVVAWSIAGALGVVSLASPRARDTLARGLAWFGRAVGNVVGTVLLTLVFVLAIVPARVVKWLAGRDDLRLRPEKRHSYYEPCDPADRKLRYAHAMFATEVRPPRRGRLVVAIATAFVLVGAAEGILRLQGFGPNAVVYTSDVRIGYYPAPNQKHQRYGGRVQTNRYGMRAPDFDEVKPEGTFRILMLGDSTLWGGSYVDQDQLYARLVKRKLTNLTEGTGKVEVLNMGVNGWGPFHERGFVEEFGTFDADLVIICMPADDLERDKYTLTSLPFFTAEQPPKFALEEVMMHGAWRLTRRRHPLGEDWREQQRELGLREYERLALYLLDGDPRGELTGPPPKTRVGGAEVFVEILPSAHAGIQNRPLDEELDLVGRLTERFQAHGVPVHFPVGLFAGKGDPDDLYHDEGHLHWKGHAIYADFLFEKISTSSLRFKQFLARRQAQKAL